MTTFNEIIKKGCEDVLDKVMENPKGYKPAEIETLVLKKTNELIRLENPLRDKDEKIKLQSTLHFVQVAIILTRLHYAKRIALGGLGENEDNDIIGLYDNGIYTTSVDAIRKVARQYNETLRGKEFDEILTYLRDTIMRVERNTDKDLIAVNNGIFNYATKKLEPFSPNVVFTVKCGVDYNENAKLKTFYNKEDDTTWDVESWMSELSDDPEIVDLLWQIMSAIVRPNVRWNKSAWFYSEEGNNGKGTLCVLMRNLCGDKAHTSIPISQFSQDFMLEPLIRTNAIIVDENDVGVFIDKCANLKAVITNDLISINRKHKVPITYRFKGFMVQCLNGFPRVRDRSDSFYRRQLFVPFNKIFTGRERTYIKDVYMNDKDVLEYVLKKVLNSNFYKLSEPVSCKMQLEEYKIANDPIRDFMNDIGEELVWDLVPTNFIYELYLSWLKKYNPQGKQVSKNTFSKDIKPIFKSLGWEYKESVRPTGKMNKPEHLILEYDLKDWMDESYKGDDLDKKCTPKHLKPSYRGYVRITP